MDPRQWISARGEEYLHHLFDPVPSAKYARDLHLLLRVAQEHIELYRKAGVSIEHETSPDVLDECMGFVLGKRVEIDPRNYEED